MVRLHFVGAGWAQIGCTGRRSVPSAHLAASTTFVGLNACTAPTSVSGSGSRRVGESRGRGLIAFLPEHHVHAVPALGREIVQCLNRRGSRWANMLLK